MGSSEPIQRKVEDGGGSSVGESDDESQPRGSVIRDVELAVPLVEKKRNGDEKNDESVHPGRSDAPTTNSGNDAGTLQWAIRNTKKNAKVLSACSFYSFCSVSMVLVNKSLASRYVEQMGMCAPFLTGD
jgi:hypothetical protein